MNGYNSVDKLLGKLTSGGVRIIAIFSAYYCTLKGRFLGFMRKHEIDVLSFLTMCIFWLAFIILDSTFYSGIWCVSLNSFIQDTCIILILLPIAWIFVIAKTSFDFSNVVIRYIAPQIPRVVSDFCDFSEFFAIQLELFRMFMHKHKDVAVPLFALYLFWLVAAGMEEWGPDKYKPTKALQSAKKIIYITSAVFPTILFLYSYGVPAT